MFNELKQPLPIYDSLDKQQVNESGFISTHNIFNFCPANRLIPFQHYKNSVGVLIIYLVDKTGKETDITGNLTDLTQKTIMVNGDVYQYYRYFGNDTFSAIDEGEYYLHFNDGVNEWFSEWFSVINDISTNLIQLEWYNTRDILENFYYLFQDNFKFRMWIPGFIKENSKYSVFERISTRFNNETIKPYQKKTKLYSLISPINAFMGDALEIAELCDNIWITNQRSENKQITITDIKFDEIPETDIQELELEFKSGFIERGNLDTDAQIVVSESGIYRGDKKIYRGDKKIVR